jgi:hypothetical protein
MYEELKDKIRELEEVEICFVQCSLESWLLADEKAIEYLISEKTKRSVKVKNFSNPESIPKPKDEIREIFRKTGVRISYI